MKRRTFVRSTLAFLASLPFAAKVHAWLRPAPRVSTEEMVAYYERNTKAKAWLDANGFKTSLTPLKLSAGDYTMARVWHENEQGETTWSGSHIAFPAEVRMPPWHGALRSLDDMNFVIEHRDPLFPTVELDNNWNTVKTVQGNLIATYRFDRPTWL